MSPHHYKIRSIRKKSLPGITGAVACSLDAILKSDGIESPYCVYSELVALQLAQTIHIPVANGVLTTTNSSEAYASIEIASPGLHLPDLLPTQYKNAALKYPNEAAALIVFDIFIGNWDRNSNIKASFVTPHRPIFQGFDHEHALLGVENNPMDSIKTLSGTDLIVKSHPFYGLIPFMPMAEWSERINEIDDAMIHECCEFNRPLGAVTTEIQQQLADALCKRKDNLPKLIVKNISHISQWK
jgi:hypothetical protein